MSVALVGCRKDSDSGTKPASPLTSPNANSTQAPVNSEGTPSAGTSQSPIQPSKDDRTFTTTHAEGYKAIYPMEFNCAKDLCQPIFDKYPSIIKAVEAAKTPTAEQKSYYDQYIKPAIVSFNSTRKEQLRQWLSAMQNREAEFKTTQLSDDQLRVIQTFSFLQKAKDYPELVKYWTDEMVKVPFYHANMIFQSMGKWTYLGQMYPDMSLENAAKVELKVANEILAKLAEVIRGVDPVDPAISAKIQAGQPLDIEEVEAFTSNVGSLRLIDHFFFGEGTQVIRDLIKKHPVTTTQLYDIYKKSSLKSDMQTLINTDLKDTCSDKYFQSINLYPQPAQLEKYKILAEQTRATALAQLSTQDPAYEKVQAIKFLYPPTASANSTAWLRSLTSEINSMKADSENVKTMDIQSLYSISLLRAVSGSIADKKDLCPRIPDSDISDKNMVMFGYVMISWYSTRYPEVGASILAHEIGHTVFEYSNGIETTKACVIGKQTSDKFANEDFADVFAAKVGAELALKYQIPQGNVGCNLMENLTLLKQNNSDDTHSSVLFRALQYATASGKTLPQSCQDLANRDNAQALKVCN